MRAPRARFPFGGARSGLVALAAPLVLGACLAACAPPPKTAALADMDRARAGAGAREGANLAPEAYAHAEMERSLALQADAAGDQVSAELYADRAMAAYAHALAIARLARATADLADAQKAFADASAQDETMAASRAQLETQAGELEQRARVAEERLLPAPSAKTTADREAARLVASRSLAVEARLLCDAAKLVAPEAAGLAEVDGAVTKLEERLAKAPHPAPIDEAARARARCLDVLTRARRGGQEAGASDALLAELSATATWAPSRDERGVVVVLHDVFRGNGSNQLTDDGVSRLKELGQVASAHPAFAVQVVVHDATARRANDTTDEKRADAAVQALVAGGAPAARVKSELAGTAEPIVDPADASTRARNERLEVTFVAGAR